MKMVGVLAALVGASAETCSFPPSFPCHRGGSVFLLRKQRKTGGSPAETGFQAQFGEAVRLPRRCARATAATSWAAALAVRSIRLLGLHSVRSLLLLALTLALVLRLRETGLAVGFGIFLVGQLIALRMASKCNETKSFRSVLLRSIRGHSFKH